MGTASILTQTSSSFIGTGGSSLILHTASGSPCSSYTTALDGGDVAEENARITLLERRSSLDGSGGNDAPPWRWKAALMVSSLTVAIPFIVFIFENLCILY